MIKVSVHSEKHFRADIEEGDPHHYWYASRINNFPEVKWHKEGYWTFPMTEPNVDALKQLSDTTVSYDENAATVLQYLTLTIQLAISRESRRWKYIFDDPDLHITQVEGENGCDHTVRVEGGETRTYYIPKASFRHQIVGLDAMHGQEFFALFMEMGTGKTKAVIDELTLSSREKPITVLIVCPKTILGTWARELAKWAPREDIFVDRLKTGDLGMENLIKFVRNKSRMRIMFANYDKLVPMKEALMAMKFNVMVCDESSRLKNPSAQRTKAAIAIGPFTDRRFIMSGSPVTGSVMDFFSQFEFLQPGVLGYSTFNAFKNHYSNLQGIKDWQGPCRYLNMDELKRRVARHSFIVKKEQCLDLPDKLYQTIQVTMGKQQKKVYDQMVQVFIAELEMESGANGVVEARSTLAKLMRLAQITQGFIRNTGPDSDGSYMDIPDGDVKLRELMRILQEDVDVEQKVIIWARFKRDVERVSKALEVLGQQHIILTGSTPQCDRDTIEERFNDGPIKYLIGEPGTGGMGLTLLGNKDAPCRTAIYYSNDYSLEKRVQSEDRCHRIGQMHNALYLDIVCKGSVDEHIADRLQAKRDLSEEMKNMSSIKALLLGNRDDDDDDDAE